MTAPRKPVAWIDPRGLERLMDGKQELVSGKPTSADDSVGLYTAPDLQPLWALVEKWADCARQMRWLAQMAAERGDEITGDLRRTAAETAQTNSDELRTTLEAL